MRRQLSLLTVLAAILAFAAPASAATWQQHKGPVLTATLPWEDTSVFEPTVIWDKDRYRLWYTARWFYASVGYAESRDGIHWKKWPKPILNNALHSTVVKTRTGFSIYYAGTGQHVADRIKLATTRDGVHIDSDRTILVAKPGSWYSAGFGNTFAWKDSRGWRLLFDAVGGNDDIWRMGFAAGTSSTQFAPTTRPLNVGVGGMYGGMWRDGHCLYFHASRNGQNLPTKIYRRCGPSLYELGPAQVVFGTQQSWQVDQVADPSIARRPGHAPLMLFDGLDNPKELAAIGAAWLKHKPSCLRPPNAPWRKAPNGCKVIHPGQTFTLPRHAEIDAWTAGYRQRLAQTGDSIPGCTRYVFLAPGGSEVAWSRCANRLIGRGSKPVRVYWWLDRRHA